ncbi:MAG: hypothetical protein FWG59_07435 [Betaproteobacteria bacterium]|nr:hypothetical protein [Betaproteobacteria bacterium]
MEVLRAKRGRCPLSLVIFVLEFRNKNNKDVEERELIRCIGDYASPCDSLGLLPKRRYALLLPGAEIFRARNIAEHILQRFENSGCNCTAGIASAKLPENAHAETLLQQAITTLRQNQHQSGKVSVYHEQADVLSLHKTLVHSHEKRFLFSGGE